MIHIKFISTVSFFFFFVSFYKKKPNYLFFILFHSYIILYIYIAIKTYVCKYKAKTNWWLFNIFDNRSWIVRYVTLEIKKLNFWLFTQKKKNFALIGRVKLGIHQITGKKVAIKIIPRSQLNSSIKITRSVERELAVLQLLHHPNLIDLHQVLQDQQNVYFVTEYVAGGELFYFIHNKGRLSESEAKDIFVQIAKALSWCHARNIW